MKKKKKPAWYRDSWIHWIMEQYGEPNPSELNGGKNVFKVVYLSSKRMYIGKSPYFRSVEMDIIFVDETKSSQE